MKSSILNRGYLCFGLLLLLLFSVAPSRTARAAPAQSAAAPSVTPPITKILQVQPIILANDDGSQTARFLGVGPGEVNYEYIIAYTNQVWAQAGIYVIVLPAKRWNNTFANSGDPCQYDGHTGTGAVGDPCTGGTRSGDVDTFIQAAEAAGVASVGLHSTVLDAYFLRVGPGQPSTSGAMTGLGNQLNNSLTMFIGDDGWLTDPTGRDTTSVVFAHEIGHSLGLPHTDQDPTINGCPDYNLMLSNECSHDIPRGIQLLPSQIATARQGRLVPVPALPVAKNMVNNTLLAVQNMSLGKDVKVALSLTLEATKLALQKNKPVQACTALTVYDASVAFYLSKGKLTASQGRQLNTASKDIRAPIGCQAATSVKAAEARFTQTEAIADNGEAALAAIRQLLADAAAEENGSNTSLFLPLITR